MKLTKAQRKQVFDMFGGKCAYCGCDLPEKGWHADHIKPVDRELKWGQDPKTGYGRMVATGKLGRPENDHIDNIFPACAPCNIDKGPNDLEGWRGWLNERIVDGLRRNSSTFRHAERFGRVVIVREPLVFWFERFALEVANG
jgi:hypothetical protein